MRTVIDVFAKLPPQIQQELFSALDSTRQEYVRGMSMADNPISMGRAQGKHEVMQLMVDGLAQVAAGAQRPARNMSGLGQVVAHPATSGSSTP